MKKKFVLCAMLSLLSNMLLAYDFSAADKAFAAREDLNQLAQAKSQYEASLSQVSGKELLYAVEQLSKLAYYEGDLRISREDADKRLAVFDKCLATLEKVNPSAVGQNVVFHYWKGVCLGLWGKAAGMVRAGMRVGEMRDALDNVIKLDDKYEGGGVHRMYAALLVHSKLLWLQGLYDPARAAREIDAAISLSGDKFYNAYLIKSDVMAANGASNDERAQMLQNAREKLTKALRNGSSPADLVPENKMILQRIVAELRNL